MEEGLDMVINLFAAAVVTRRRHSQIYPIVLSDVVSTPSDQCPRLKEEVSPVVSLDT